jgi:outer membrane immunogenic protein
VGGTTAGGVDFTSQQNIDWFGTVRGRVGVAFDRVLVYGTGGFAYGNVSQHANYSGDVFSSNTTQTGYAVGGGVEYKINPAWSLKAEYQYIDLGCDRLTDSLGNTTNPLDTTFQTVRAGVNYHFGGGYVPLK